MRILPARSIRGEIDLPGDKSISHRAAMFSAMANGDARIENFASSADCASTLECLRRLGVEIGVDGTTVGIGGVGKTGFKQPSGPLDCENSGTTFRLLSGIVAGQTIDVEMTGDESLQKRPMGRIIEPLSRMGASLESSDGRAPVRITGKNPLTAIDYEPPVASAQLKSCVLLAGLLADGNTSVLEKTPTRDHTERMLGFLGVEIEREETRDGVRLTVSGENVLTARDMRIPGDISGAAFFMVAAASLPGSEILIRNVGLNSSRTAIIAVLKNFGAEIEVMNESEAANEPVGDILVKRSKDLAPRSEPNLLKGSIIANLIDEIPVLAVFGTRLPGGLEVREANELRVKESDRIAAVVKNLERMGADVEEFPDGFRVGRSELKGASVESYGDHRIAMAFAVAGLMAGGETHIDGAGCAAVSFPTFFEVLESAAVRS